MLDTLDTTEEKQALHELIDRMPGEAVHALRAIAQLLVHREMEYDDEELSPEFAAKLREAQESFARGEPGIPHAEILREFGL